MRGHEFEEVPEAIIIYRVLESPEIDDLVDLSERIRTGKVEVVRREKVSDDGGSALDIDTAAKINDSQKRRLQQLKQSPEKTISNDIERPVQQGMGKPEQAKIEAAREQKETQESEGQRIDEIGLENEWSEEEACGDEEAREIEVEMPIAERERRMHQEQERTAHKERVSIYC